MARIRKLKYDFTKLNKDTLENRIAAEFKKY
jgi:hypothetical protein